MYLTDGELAAFYAGWGMSLWYEAASDPTTTPGAAAMAALETLVACSSTFQTAVAATGTDEEKITFAKTKIYLTAYESSAFARPFALICKVGNDRNVRAGTSCFEVSGDLELRLETAISTANQKNLAAAEAAFLNYYENVITEMKALAATPGYLLVRAIDVLEGPVQIEDKAGVYYNGIRLLVSWGIG